MRAAAAAAITVLALGAIALAAPPARADGEHSLSGTVFLPGGQTSHWLSGISVTADGPVTVTVPVDPVVGTFAIPSLPQGDYTLKASGSVFTQAGNTYIVNVVPEFFGGSYTVADTISLSDEDLTGLDIFLDRGGILRGDAVLPGGWASSMYEGVLVTADGPAGASYTTTPGADGSFFLFGLAPGDYLLRAEPQEYGGNPAPALVTTYYPESYEHASPLWIPAATSDAGQYWTFALPESHTISGTVDVEGDHAHELLSGVVVTAHAGQYEESPWTTVDPDTGEWSITGLPGLSYQVEFSGPLLITQWYNDAPDQDSSTLVEPWVSDVTGIDASMVRTRSISGEVVLPGGASEDWYQGIRVRLMTLDGIEVASSGVGTVNHTFTLDDLTPGTYKVRFDVQPYWDYENDELVQPNLLSEWFDDAASLATATVVDISSGSQDHIDATLASGLTIGGTVTYPAGTSAEVKGAAFVYTEVEDDYRYGVFDVDSGTYAITGLRPGTYELHFGDNGVFDPETADYLPTGLFPWVVGATEYSPIAEVTVTSSDATLNVEYRQGARIRGHVSLDPLAPSTWMSGVYVEINGDNGYAKVRPNPTTGDFATAPLPPGEYRVSFDSEPVAIEEPPGYVWPNLVPEYYDDSPFPDNAATVTLGTTDATGIDAQLALGRAISGRITIPSSLPEQAYEGITAYATDAEGNSWSAHVGPSGEYGFRGLASGAYILHFAAGDYFNGFEDVPTGLISEYYNDATTLADADPVDVTAGDAPHVDATLELGGWISGHITLPLGADPDWYGGIAVSARQDSRVVYGTVNSSGDYQITGLPVGDWLVEFAVGEYYDDDTHTVETPNLASIYYPNATSAGSATLVTSTASGATGKNVTMPSGGQTFTSMPTPTIGGSAAYGNTLTATPGTWLPEPDGIEFQWNRDGAPISGATNWLYMIGDADLGHVLTVTVTARRIGFVTQSQTSGGVSVAPASPFSLAPLPTISGSKYKGAVLTAKPGSWIPTPSAFAYQWYRNGSLISGATKSTYTLTASDASKTITVKVTSSLGGYVSTARTSAGSAMPKFFTSTPTPTVSGTLKSGYTLTAKVGTWAPKASGLKYQWYRNGVAISKATKTTYKLTTSDRGKTITFRVTGSLSGYGTTPVTSAGKYVPKVFTTVPTPTISGTLKSGSTLTAKAGTWKPTPTKLTYQWYRNGVAIKSATKSTYRLTSSDKGKKVTVKVTATLSGYLTASKTSSAKTVAK
ncbi:hypothetical protein [Demequina sp.]|uniref:hypothetical protein n=1 Tax=Demequina sp. TaxID=2050685 RepID=UPI003D0BB9A4